MAPPSSVLSRTLQSITETKIRELAKQRAKYEDRKQAVITKAETEGDKRSLVMQLMKGVNELYPASSSDNSLSNITRWLDQSRFDASIPDHMIKSFEDQLRGRLDIQTRKLNLADLYSRLFTEWALSDAAFPVPEESFEVVDRQKERLQDLCDKFESVVFEPLETDEVEIDLYLQDLFSGDGGIKALEGLRNRVKRTGKELLSDKAPFDEWVLTWCIKGLLVEDLLSDEKQKTLQDFLENKLVLGEIADVLNMRFADFDNWSWEAGDEGIPVMPRQQLNGKYRIWMDEDVLQAIFIHYLGIQWSIHLKSHITSLTHDKNIWKGQQSNVPSQVESEKRAYQLSRPTSQLGGRDVFDTPQYNVDEERNSSYADSFFLSSLPGSIQGHLAGGGYDTDEPEEGAPKYSNIKQQLLRKIATEVLLHRSLHGKVGVIQSDMKWYATGLSHTTIFAIMRFVGYSEKWIMFFRKFLEAPLNMSPASGDDNSKDKVRTRKRGVPMAHAPEKLIGELVLFMMDLAVNKEAGMLLYRLHDDLWLCGEPERCARAWTAMKHFATVIGLEFNESKTGSVYISEKSRGQDPKVVATLPKGKVCIGFLELDPDSGIWLIDQKQVDIHVNQLKKQLVECNSVLSWVQTWNSCIGRFFSHTFGDPAYCFGQQHVDSILETHERIQKFLFDGKDGNGSNVVEHLKNLISSRFGVTDVPDAFLYVPEQFGGLGLRNPFIQFFLVRKELTQDPMSIMEDFLKEEKEEYAEKKKQFEELSEKEKFGRLRAILQREISSKDAAWISKWETFMSFEEFTNFREHTSFNLRSKYSHLLTVPLDSEISLSPQVRREIETLKGASLVGGKGGFWDLDSEKKWILQLHADELFEKCGGLTVVDKSFLPLGVLTMIRKKKVTWQMVL